MYSCYCRKGKADKVVDKAKKAGARGATILYGRGQDNRKHWNFYIHIEASKEIILILSETDSTNRYTMLSLKRVDLMNQVPASYLLFSIRITRATP